MYVHVLASAAAPSGGGAGLGRDRYQADVVARSGSGRKGAVEAVRDFIPQPPDCRQVTSLAPMAAWRLLPSSKKVWPLGPEDFWIDDAISESRRGLVGSDAAEAGRRRAYEASRAQQSNRPPIAKRAIRERYGKR